MIPLQNHLSWKVSLSILHGIAIFSTCLRLETRRRTRRLWWDDYTTIIPAITDCLNIAMLWLRLRNKTMPREERALFSYLGGAFFATINWWSRISLALAVVRITPVWSRSRRLATGMTIAFFCFWVALFLGMTLTCVVHTEWQFSDSQILICGPASRVAVANTVCDVISDIALIAIPLHQLWDINLPANERLRVRLVFSASSITLVASIALCTVSYGGYIVGPGALVISLASSHTAANIIYCPPPLQVQLDLQSWILRAEEKDYSTTYSYFFEAFENINALGKTEGKGEKAWEALEYMPLRKVMLKFAVTRTAPHTISSSSSSFPPILHTRTTTPTICTRLSALYDTLYAVRGGGKPNLN
ncbi:hypothetical protein CVT25_013017 [Psilocybe cyanescens]|uniref:Rhodopsin domain-containing protein n=1 Tax=Psilocybe cyanescens TaxID=93625 RepID=A0A409XLR4_PSICY|nr:hypothetical protein CVT25_013017 [Psilocybe cyanescens]